MPAPHSSCAPRRFVTEAGPLDDIAIPAVLRPMAGDTRPLLPPRATGVEALVCQDIARRQLAGLGAPGCANRLSPADHLHLAYQHALDTAINLRRAIAECEASGAQP